MKNSSKYEEWIRNDYLGKEKLIKMYEELKDMPVIKCKYLEFFKTGISMYCINYSAKNNYISTCMSSTLEKKDGMIITDDFIFIKEI